LKVILILTAFVLFFPAYGGERKIETEKVIEKAEKAHKELDERIEKEKILEYQTEISENAKKINTIKSKFKQVKHLSFLSDKVETGGVFLLKKDNGANFVKWEYVTPFSYQIVLDGKSVFMKDGDKVTKFDMNSNSVFEELNQIMIGSLNGTILSENEKFSFNITEKEKELFVSMIPSQSSMKEYFKEIRMVINKNDYTVTKLEMIEAGGDATEILFDERKINGPIDNKEFQLK
jgi:outer membrane lipoprotein-sorting protein